MTRALAALAAIALFAAACTTAPSLAPTTTATTAPSATPGATAGPTGGPTAEPTPAPTSATTATVRVYFFLGSFTGNGGLVPVERHVPSLEPAGAIQRAAIEALLAGPSETELSASPAMYTAVPEGTHFLALEISGGIATVDLSGGFESGGEPTTAKGRLAQVVYTLTQFPGVTGVRFALDGKPVTGFAGAGRTLDVPVNRMDFTDQLPPIFLDQPAWGAVLGNPAHLVGLANAFEATFHSRILDAGGHSLADGPVKASCGTGCWGTFDVAVPYLVPATAPGTLQVYELSAADGSIVNLTEYPVTLTP